MAISRVRSQPQRSRPTLAKESARASRQMLYVTLGGFLVLFAILAMQVLGFGRAIDAAQSRSVAAERLGEKILADQEVLALWVRLSVLSGDLEWQARYLQRSEAVRIAVDSAKALASPAAADRFERGTKAAVQSLDRTHASVFASVAGGHTALAEAVLAGPGYAYHRDLLRRSTADFLEALRQAKREQVAHLQRNGTIALLMSALIGLAVIGALVLWLVARARRAHERVEEGLLDLAMRDQLTGLHNRFAFQDELSRVIEAAAATRPSPPSRSVLVSIDINGFRTVNATRGHDCGDSVLKEVAARLSRVYGNAFLSRIGGDEFVALFATEDDLPTVTRDLAERHKAMREPIRVGDVVVSVSIAAGVAMVDGTRGSRAVRNGAELALGKAKLEGLQGATIAFTEAMDQEHAEVQAKRESLRSALAQREFVPFFQPIVDLRTGRPIAAEVLARWQQTDGRVISPHAFVGELEAMRRLPDLTRLMIEEACAAARQWPLALSISVNVPPREIDRDFCERLLSVLSQHDLPPQRFEIEVLETALAGEDGCTAASLERLRGHGIRVALDDFGVGYSSLGQLASLPVDKLKIDRSFVMAMRTDARAVDGEEVRSGKRADAVVRAGIELGEAFGIHVVAEGVETDAHRRALLSLGATLGQGYHFAAPMDQTAFVAFQTEHHKGSASVEPTDALKVHNAA